MNRTIEIIIGTTGEIQIDAVGFKGPDCEQATNSWKRHWGWWGRRSRNLNTTSAAPGSVSRGLAGESR